MFKNWLRHRLFNLLNEPTSIGMCKEVATNSTRTGLDYNHNSPLNFRMFGAHGGTVIEFSKYDRKTDEHRTSIHIIPETADFSTEVAKIITMEQIKNF